MSINIRSAAEWQTLLSSTNVVIADFYADWCGPCKMIAPHFEKLAKENSVDKKFAFAKVNVDSQSTIAKTNGVSAMPTFKIFHNGTCVETLKGANPNDLSDAIGKASKLATTPGGQAGDVFKTPGRTLGGDSAQGAGGGLFRLDAGRIFRVVLMIVGMYLVSFFAIDAAQAAENSWFNKYGSSAPKVTAEKKPLGETKAKAPVKKFRTLADLSSE